MPKRADLRSLAAIMFTKAGSMRSDIDHAGAAGRQGRACGAPLRGRRTLTAARRREVGSPCRRGRIRVTLGDASGMTSLRWLLQIAAKCFELLQTANAIHCNFMQKIASECFVMFQFVACTPVHHAQSKSIDMGFTAGLPSRQTTLRSVIGVRAHWLPTSPKLR